MVTGTSIYQELFQGLLAEGAFYNGRNALVPLMKLTGDSMVYVNRTNDAVPDNWDYISMSYVSGSNLQIATFRRGGSSGTILTTLTMTYDGLNNLLTVTKS